MDGQVTVMCCWGDGNSDGGGQVQLKDKWKKKGQVRSLSRGLGNIVQDTMCRSGHGRSRGLLTLTFLPCT